MKLSDKWFTALSENDNGDFVAIYGRDELTEFMQSGKLKERVEITWKYIPAEQGMPSDAEAERMEAVEVALRKAMEKDKLAIGDPDQCLYRWWRKDLGLLYANCPGVW